MLLACPWASQAEVYSPYPGLPEPSFPSGSWGYVAQGGIAETAKARQWVAVPPTTVGYWSGQVRRDYAPEPGALYRDTIRGEAFFVSPPGAAEPYGYLPPLRVRTVGFGLLPVEAVVQVRQRRSGGRPLPVVATVVGTRFDDDPSGPNGPSGSMRLEPVRIEDAFEVRVTKVLVDGVDIGLTGACRTVRPAPVVMVGPGHVIPPGVGDPQAYFRALDPTTFFHPLYGGQLAGSLDLPAFTGCTTESGDDLSPMITLSVSGPGNRAVFNAGFPCTRIVQGTQMPPAPGEWNTLPVDETYPCTTPDPMDYPDRPAD
ncbi:hypothetical protein [Nocardioides sp. L-11A]|uniref:hypothetical protein n=1 Tax=Nocardioides sp. L-11A TaxID=3043848 RepID=UPI00249CD7C7|nr:hypothetical protein QJ852_05875 [Nocardioides sp. L-11A]